MLKIKDYIGSFYDALSNDGRNYLDQRTKEFQAYWLPVLNGFKIYNPNNWKEFTTVGALTAPQWNAMTTIQNQRERIISILAYPIEAIAVGTGTNQTQNAVTNWYQKPLMDFLNDVASKAPKSGGGDKNIITDTFGSISPLMWIGIIGGGFLLFKGFKGRRR
jgi:hypothetical protein